MLELIVLCTQLCYNQQGLVFHSQMLCRGYVAWYLLCVNSEFVMSANGPCSLRTAEAVAQEEDVWSWLQGAVFTAARQHTDEEHVALEKCTLRDENNLG